MDGSRARGKVRHGGGGGGGGELPLPPPPGLIPAKSVPPCGNPVTLGSICEQLADANTVDLDIVKQDANLSSLKKDHGPKYLLLLLATTRKAQEYFVVMSL